MSKTDGEGEEYVWCSANAKIQIKGTAKSHDETDTTEGKQL